MAGTRISLDSLPNDVQHMILSYLSKPLSGYALDGTPRNLNIFRQLERLQRLQPSIKALLRTHPFQNLAATCKPLRGAVEGYCNHLLNCHGQMMAVKKMPELDEENWEELAAKNCKRKKTKARRQTYRNLWVRKSHEHCFWCGRKSKRHAIFDLLVYCCHECDEKIYGKRVSKSVVISQYKIRPLHYLYPSHVFADSGFKPLSTAMRSICGGVEATYLLEEEVKALAEYAKAHDPRRILYRHAAKIFGLNGEKIQDAKRDEDNCKSVLFWDVKCDTKIASCLTRSDTTASMSADHEGDGGELSGDFTGLSDEVFDFLLLINGYPYSFISEH